MEEGYNIYIVGVLTYFKGLSNPAVIQTYAWSVYVLHADLLPNFTFLQIGSHMHINIAKQTYYKNFTKKTLNASGEQAVPEKENREQGVIFVILACSEISCSRKGVWWHFLKQ